MPNCVNFDAMICDTFFWQKQTPTEAEERKEFHMQAQKKRRQKKKMTRLQFYCYRALALLALATLVIMAVALIRLPFRRGAAKPTPAPTPSADVQSTEPQQSAQTAKSYTADEILADRSAYPQELIDMVLRNPETADFVGNYAALHTQTQEIYLTDDLAAGGFPRFQQWDLRWGYRQYTGRTVSDTLGLSGCGPTALSMVAVYVTGDAGINPWVVAQYAEENGYTDVGGTTWSLFSQGSAHFGLHAEEVNLWESAMANALAEGKPIVCSVGPGDFTRKGHFIVLCGYSDGYFEIRDPFSRANSEKKWSYEQLEPQILGMWAFSKA